VAEDKVVKSKSEDKGKGKPSKPDGEEQSGGFNVGALVQGTKEELGKVVWPSRQQLISESAGVILMVSLSATLIYFVDNLLRFISSKVFVG
jgi:preprotein translocase subunit SecE